MSLDIIGSAYWWPSLGKYQVPEEIWALPPHLVYPVFDTGNMVPSKYLFGGVEYAKADLIRFRRLSAKNPYGQGYGPEQAAIEYARLEDTFVSIQDNMLSNGPRPSLIVSHRDPKGAFGSAERERLEAEMEHRGRGGRAGGVFVIDGAATVTPISYTPTDLGGLEISSYDLERIANCFDVPVSLLKTEDVNRANAEAGLEQHGRHAVEPRCRLIASTLTRWTHSLDVKGARGWDRLFWAFDPVVAEDKQAEAELHKVYIDLGVLSRNEVRLELGYEPAEGGDVLLVRDRLAPLAGVAKPNDVAV
jgi:phage portal protein BeeE